MKNGSQSVIIADVFGVMLEGIVEFWNVILNLTPRGSRITTVSYSLQSIGVMRRWIGHRARCMAAWHGAWDMHPAVHRRSSKTSKVVVIKRQSSMVDRRSSSLGNDAMMVIGCHRSSSVIGHRPWRRSGGVGEGEEDRSRKRRH
eukprot:1638038-Pyramimonas_sp.AAC.1